MLQLWLLFGMGGVGRGNKGGKRVQRNCLAWFVVGVGQTLVLVVAPTTGLSIELMSDWLLMITHNGGVFSLDPGLGVFCCILREKGLEHIVDCVCDG